MHFPPFEDWPVVTETIHGQQIEFRCPPDSPERLQTMVDYWAGNVHDKSRVRSHRWGGYIEKAHYGPLDRLLFFKRFSIRNPRYLHKPLRARGTILQEERIQKAGFNTARIVGLAERKVLGITVDSAVVHEAVTGATPAFWLLHKKPYRSKLSLHECRTLAFGLGTHVGRWHNAGLFHGDMHAGNMFCRIHEESIDVWWLDNEEGTQYPSIPISKRIHDLDHMSRFKYNMPDTDRMRFWETYTRECGISGEERKQLARHLTRKTAKYLRKKGKI